MSQSQSNLQSPAYFDFEVERRKWRAMVWVAVGTMGIVSVIAILSAVGFALAVSTKPVPVVVFDSTGRPIVFEETNRPAHEVSLVRVQHMASVFAEKFVAIDAQRLDEDFQASLNMMTPGLQEWIAKDGQALDRREAYRGSNARSRLTDVEYRVADFDPADDKQDIGLYLWGKNVFGAAEGYDETQELFVFIVLQLRRTEVTRQTPYGLLVNFVEYYSFDSAKELELEILKRRRG